VFTNSMDYKNAKEKLSELRDSLNEVLGSKGEGPSREDAEEALKAAKDGARRAKKTLLGRVKDFPVVDKIAQLGTAGTVAVGTAAVTQTNIAVDETEVFVASVANDVVEQRFYVPPILDRLIDFPSLDSWGQAVMQEKVAEVQAEVAKVEAKVAPVQAKETKAKAVTESQAAEETESQEPQAQEESTNNSEEDGGDAEEIKQDAEEVDSEEVEETEQSSEEEIAEPVPEEESGESADEIDEVKPHSDVQSDESEQPLLTPDDLPSVSPEGPRQV
jgi:flagellar biosynthesis GTPase FlhF